MILQEYSEKDGQEWDQKHNKDHILIKNIKMYFTACHLNSDNNSKDKLKQD